MRYDNVRVRSFMRSVMGKKLNSYMVTCKLKFIVAGVDGSRFATSYECSATFFREEPKENLSKIPYND